MAVMPAHIPPGRERLWQRQAEADAEVARAEAEWKAAERKALDLAQALQPRDSITEDAADEADRLWTESSRAQAVANRVYEERIAGLTSWIDENPTDPICPDCQGTGGPPGYDASGACGTCRGWGREHRPPIPVWHDAHSGEPAGWYDPATGRAVDLFGASEQEPPMPDTTGADVNEATKGVVEGVSKITPTGLAASVASGVTGKDINSPLATAAGSTSGGGAGVSHAEEGNAQIQQAGQDIETAMGAIQEIVSNLESAQQNLTGAAEESQHSEADTAMGALQEAVSAANDLQQQVGAAKQAVEDVKL